MRDAVAPSGRSRAGSKVISFSGILPCDGRWGLTRSNARSFCPVRVRLESHSPRARRTREPLSPSIHASAGPSVLYEGAVVEVSLSANRRRVAIAQRADGKKNWIVTDAQGTMASVAPRQVTFHLGASAEIGADLASIEADLERTVEEADGLLELAWEILSESDSPVRVNDVADIIFGNSKPSSLYAAHVMLQRDKTFFKTRLIKGSFVYEPRSEALVREARMLAEAENSRLEEQERKKKAIALSVSKCDMRIAEDVLGAETIAQIVEALISIAQDGVAFGSDAKGEATFQMLGETVKKDIRFVLGALERPIAPASAFDVLVAWGVFCLHENLFLRKSGLMDDLAHTADVLKSADELMQHVPADRDAQSRRDLTHLIPFAVDSEDTREVDDAFSWDPENNLVWVHIADPTRYFKEGVEHPLAIDALRRVATLYLPTGKSTMFPEKVATRLFSLGAADGDGSAVSIGFRVLDDGVIDEDRVQVACTRISAPRRMTYEEADELLAQAQEEDDLAVLLRKAELRKVSRKHDGAVISDTPFSSVRVQNAESNAPEISLGIVRTDTRSWTLVSELMISACMVAGLFAEENKVPLIFRGQSPFPMPPADAVAALPEGPARLAAVFKNAGPSSTGVEPMNHASLGVDAYAQVTSPIRRATDLIAHFQIKAVLRGEQPPFDKAALVKEIGRDADRGKRLRGIENRSNKYWQMEYLRTLPAGTEHEATFVKFWKEEERLGIVFLNKYAFDVFLQVPMGVKAGDSLMVVFTSVNPKAGQCRAFVRSNRSENERGGNTDTLNEIVSDVEPEEAFP